MKKQYQVTLFDSHNKYRPISCIVKHEQNDDTDLSVNASTKRAIMKEGITKICLNRYTSYLDLRKQGFDTAKVRAYDKEKIERENAERYQAIKEAKYASGEWKRPRKEGGA